MKTRLLSFTFLLSALLAMPAWSADRKVEDYSKTIDAFKQSATVAPYFASAYGYAVFPTIGKGGFGIGGAHGKGQVYRGGKVTGFTSVTDLSIGLQAGGQAEEVVHAARRLIFLKGRDAHDYKFSSAVLEDYHHVSPALRNEFLALSVFNLRGTGDKDNGLVSRIRTALDA